jgi:hypothetical protein
MGTMPLQKNHRGIEIKRILEEIYSSFDFANKKNKALVT